jgi:hypothetical protein
VRLLVAVAAVAVFLATFAASSGSAFTLGTTTTCTFYSHFNGKFEPNVYNGAITICVVVTYTFVGYAATPGTCLYTGQETDYVFLGDAGTGPVVDRGTIGTAYGIYIIYGAFRPDAPLRKFENGAANPYIGPAFTFTNPCQS